MAKTRKGDRHKPRTRARRSLELTPEQWEDLDRRAGRRTWVEYIRLVLFPLASALLLLVAGCSVESAGTSRAEGELLSDSSCREYFAYCADMTSAVVRCDGGQPSPQFGACTRNAPDGEWCCPLGRDYPGAHPKQ